MTLLQFSYNSNNYIIETTHHAEKRMQNRNISKFAVLNTIKNIPVGTLFDNRELLVRYSDYNISVVVKVENNIIVVITVMDKIAECDYYPNTVPYDIPA